MEQTETTLEERVTRGAALLDEKMPGWREKIDLDELNLRSCSFCILGQLYGLYSTGLKEIDFYPHDKEDHEINHGFTCSNVKYIPFMERVRLWSQLTQAWKKVIATGKER